ncbi:hypothetical protein AB0I06_04420 [Streptomyces sp. NPDC050674]|uniref:hypothetical protein n=1 Tax=Streptomyces sp. NPDC050674 TaxID=3157216 RepID=UPI00344177BC
MGSEEHVCPSCGQPVETVVRRHKTLGTWVPRWVAGPCRNPECGAHEVEGADTDASGTPAEPAPTPPETAPGDTAPEETVAKNS